MLWKIVVVGVGGGEVVLHFGQRMGVLVRVPLHALGSVEQVDAEHERCDDSDHRNDKDVRDQTEGEMVRVVLTPWRKLASQRLFAGRGV